ncbi:MAG: RdgB/HAM1 family non-canonical purine NTP pyrophosphatase [Opitutus sp.]|nr:RdgB/HAM1 family non-canonical purine NTP pyrophosphatase [Opitutus sp.]MCS6248658.1 RdgB/HAM1 family non-canonical purine NTP pyrophosphatase [Opitutus sp.]MCS6275484.1 RdgB/HAM1 family non-canonical purine NTP pyrophosphatase [Opitutus sp.]MCS6276567.1 RdgB/HAM1 family non-canonical purine NTP pyrophosphatase [Opitutus sp.]MCS6301784.1 RdgB/HAM1 family non-canonical purine NTP pyrophosphatase [Opitutus sp.]
MNLYLASGNAHKVAEMNALARASGLPVTIVSAKAVGGMPPVVEDTGTFVGNARKKARALPAVLPPGSWVLADDSGLCVDALGGAPGVESAYYAGPAGDGAANLSKLVDVMAAVPREKRGAQFVCVLLVIGPDGTEAVFEGRCEGVLGEVPQGGTGFGYDPLFLPDGYSESFAQLGDAVKNELSHRGRAWTELVAWMRACLVATLD